LETPDWNPGTLFQLAGSYWQCFTFHTAIKLDVFTILDDGPLSAEELAHRLDADQRATAMLLNAVTAMGFLTKNGERYANTEAATTFLSQRSQQYVGHIVQHQYHLVPSWARLPEAIANGKPIRYVATDDDEERRESFIRGMHDVAMAIAPRIADEVDLSDRKHLLDVGGGPGTYAIQFCLKNPQLTATIFDLPTTEPIARDYVEQFGLSDRIDFIGGNYLEDAIPGRYDVAWLSQILHSEGPDSCHQLVKNAASTLEPGGSIMVQEFFLNRAMDGPLFPAIFSLNMLVNTDGGQSYSEQQVMDMLSEAGAKDIRRLPFRGPIDQGIVVGTV